MQLLVIKRSGSREPYAREKLRAGVSRACSKTMVTAEQIDDLVDSVETELTSDGKREVTATNLGEIALAKLRNLDQVAYVRFASVYRQFRSIEDFVAELHSLTGQGDSGSSTKGEDRVSATISGTTDSKSK